jgi:hypothetical protein
MYGAIQPLVTRKEGCMYGAIHPLVTLKRGASMGLFKHLLHLRGAHVWGYSTPCYT